MSVSPPILAASDAAAIQARYLARFQAHGASVAALASGTAERQAIRHQVLLECGIGAADSVLDVGCGLGHWYAFAREQGWSGAYTGVDLVPEFIESCRTTYAEDAHAGWLTGDLFDSQGPLAAVPPHDWVIASQVFNNRYTASDNWTLFATALERCFGLCRRGVAVDCLTTQVDFEEPQLHYYAPARVLELGLRLTRRALLRHDYPLYEQTLYLYRD